MRETEKGAREGEREEADQMIISAEQDKWFETEPCLSAALRVIKVKKEKRSGHAPSTPEIALPAVSQASYWERGNPERSHEKKSAISQVLFVCSSTNRPDLVSLLQKQGT